MKSEKNFCNGFVGLNIKVWRNLHACSQDNVLLCFNLLVHMYPFVFCLSTANWSTSGILSVQARVIWLVWHDLFSHLILILQNLIRFLSCYIQMKDVFDYHTWIRNFSGQANNMYVMYSNTKVDFGFKTMCVVVIAWRSNLIPSLNWGFT